MALNTLTWQRCLATLAPSGTIEITENGEAIDVAKYAYADVNVSSSGAGTIDVPFICEDNAYLDYAAYFDSSAGNFVELEIETSSTDGNYYSTIKNAPIGSTIGIAAGDEEIESASIDAAVDFRINGVDDDGWLIVVPAEIEEAIFTIVK